MSFHDIDFVVSGGTGDCHNDNLQRPNPHPPPPGWKFWHHDNIKSYDNLWCRQRQQGLYHDNSMSFHCCIAVEAPPYRLLLITGFPSQSHSATDIMIFPLKWPQAVCMYLTPHATISMTITHNGGPAPPDKCIVITGPSQCWMKTLGELYYCSAWNV